MNSFWQRQFREIADEGFFALFRKLCNFFMMIIAVPVVLMVRALRPWVIIRFGRLDSSRIGHFAGKTEIYLCKRNAGIERCTRRTYDIFYYLKPICNYQLKKMWERVLNISRLPSFIYLVDRLNHYLPKHDEYVVPLDTDRDMHGLFATMPSHLSFTVTEEQQGQQQLLNLGISQGAPFVCFHSRDAAYLAARLPAYDWAYHDYRDSNVSGYILAAEELVKRGYYAVRMGAIVKDSLITGNRGIIDYATNGRTDFMDIYLAAKCRFFLGSTAGILSVAIVFRKPIAYVNYLPLNIVPFFSAQNILIPKKLWLRERRRFLTFREILGLTIANSTFAQDYEKADIEVIENTPEEIKAVAVEMDERLNGIWHSNKEDEELQFRFWSLYKPSELGGKLLPKIGAEFLRQNRQLLD